jgi:hypothetical protein
MLKRRRNFFKAPLNPEESSSAEEKPSIVMYVAEK